MRDAFGGSFMIMLFLVFIMIYICFTAVALSYAKAFKVKNNIIDYLENSELSSLESLMKAKEWDEFASYINEEIIGNKNYNMSGYNICKGYPIKDENGKTIAICHDAGIIISETEQAKNTEGVYYTVSTYLGWDIGFFSKLAALNGGVKEPEVGEVAGFWRISGQTRLIVNK